MKKLKLIAIFMILSVLTQIIVSAGSYDGVFTGLTLSVLKEYTSDDIGTYEMRGFAVSPDGKYLYGGCLQGEKRVLKIDAANGNVIGEYSDDEPGYPKGLAADDRNYLYVGIADQANNGAVRYAIVNADTMKEEYITEIEIDGKVGVNGITVKNFNGKYIIYLVTNYGPNFIYSYDVTDVKNPVPNTSFGDSGIVDLNKLLTGNEGNYIDVDSAGSIYISYNMGGGSKGDTLYKLSPDGKSVTANAPISEAYGVNVVNDEYVLVSTYDADAVYVLNTSDLSQVAKIDALGESSHYSMAAFGGNKIYVADQGYGGGGDRILVSNLLAIPEPVNDTPENSEEIAPMENDSTTPIITVTTDTPPAVKTGDDTIFMFVAIPVIFTGIIILNSRKVKNIT